MVKRHDKVRNRMFYALRNSPSAKFTEDIEPRILTDTNQYIQPDLIIVYTRSNNLFIVDFAVAYEKDSSSLKNVE
ncbi:hypothetical protein GJ496_009785 [Pomphorhynchus laevis]|nr:hypothetical protein GJ496_009785 [Pomphorhynchus laevis]